MSIFCPVVARLLAIFCPVIIKLLSVSKFGSPPGMRLISFSMEMHCLSPYENKIGSLSLFFPVHILNKYQNQN
jgi:hypothetical protein